MPEPPSVRISTTPTRPWRTVAKRYVAEHGVAFTETDVMRDRAGLRETVAMTGGHGMPVVVVGTRAHRR